TSHTRRDSVRTLMVQAVRSDRRRSYLDVRLIGGRSLRATPRLTFPPTAYSLDEWRVVIPITGRKSLNRDRTIATNRVRRDPCDTASDSWRGGTPVGELRGANAGERAGSAPVLLFVLYPLVNGSLANL